MAERGQISLATPQSALAFHSPISYEKRHQGGRLIRKRFTVHESRATLEGRFGGTVTPFGHAARPPSAFSVSRQTVEWRLTQRWLRVPRLREVETLLQGAKTVLRKRLFKIVMSGVLAGVVAGGGALTAVATELEPGSPITAIGQVTWLVIAVAFLVAAAKDWRTYTADPPSDG